MATVVRATGAPHDLVLKDYALSYLLAGMYSDAELAAVMAFKGGTALRKCFFRGYRFSEDLDFTMREPWEDAQIEERLHAALALAARMTSDSGDFRFDLAAS